MMVMPGMERMVAKSSQHWWLAPSSPTEMPPWVAPIFTFRCGYPMLLRTCSNALPAANIAKVEAKGMSPREASPAETHIRFDSAMPQSKKRSG